MLRHAKAADPDDTPDFDRPLAPDGATQARRIGSALAALEWVPDLLISSSARRARQTAQIVAERAGYRNPITEMRKIYGADCDALLTLAQDLPKSAECVLLVGHNPGFEELATRLLGGTRTGGGVKLSTGALACLSLEIDRWKDAEPGAGMLEWLLTPKLVTKLERYP